MIDGTELANPFITEGHTHLVAVEPGEYDVSFFFAGFVPVTRIMKAEPMEEPPIALKSFGRRPAWSVLNKRIHLRGYDEYVWHVNEWPDGTVTLHLLGDEQSPQKHPRWDSGIARMDRLTPIEVIA
jgi:hypothetical protein